MSSRPRTIIESPFAGDRDRNQIYLERCMEDSFNRGEAPFASHGFYPLFLEDEDAEDSKLGIECGLAWSSVAEIIVFYTDYGMSPGMLKAEQHYKEKRRHVNYRKIGQNGPQD